MKSKTVSEIIVAILIMIFVFQISYAKDNKKTDNILSYNMILERFGKFGKLLQTCASK